MSPEEGGAAPEWGYDDMAGEGHRNAEWSVAEPGFKRRLHDGLAAAGCEEREVVGVEGNAGAVNVPDEGGEGVPLKELEAGPGVPEWTAGEEPEVFAHDGSEQPVPPRVVAAGAGAEPGGNNDFGGCFLLAAQQQSNFFCGQPDAAAGENDEVGLAVAEAEEHRKEGRCWGWQPAAPEGGGGEGRVDGGPTVLDVGLNAYDLGRVTKAGEVVNEAWLHRSTVGGQNEDGYGRPC